MPSSTVKREKLLRPFHVAMIVGLFASAFLVLVPKKQIFQYATSDGANTASGPVDELDIAYLKAKLSTGARSAPEMSRLVSALVKERRVVEARELYSLYPDIALDEVERYQFDVEIAVANMWNDVEEGADQAQRFQSKRQLSNLLQLVTTRSTLQTPSVLLRTVELSDSIGLIDLEAEIYHLLAERDDERRDHWLETCGNVMAAAGSATQAITCYTAVLEQAESNGQANRSADDEIAFRTKLALLRQYYVVDDQWQQRTLFNNLLNDTTLSAVRLERFAAVLLETERPDQAHRVYIRLASVDQARSVHWLETAATWSAAAEQPAVAAEYLIATLPLRPDVEHRDVESKIESLLTSAGKNDRVLVRLRERLRENPNQLDTLQQAVVVARQAGYNREAMEWNARRLKLVPDDVDAQALQVELALANQDLATAEQWARQAVDSRPDDPALRKTLAQVLEWNGDPVSANQQWQWIAQQHPNANSLSEVVRLSTMTMQPAVAATALRQLSVQQKSTPDEVTQIVELYELEGLHTEAAVALQEIQQRHGQDAHVLRELAAMHYRHLEYRQSLLAWQQLQQQFGRASDESLYRVELHWRLNEPEKALAVARTLVGSSLMSDATDYQVRVMSELAWRYREPQLAQLVSPMLISIEDRDQSILHGQRMVEEMRSQGERKAAQQEAIRLWTDTGEADFGLLAMQLAYDRGDNETLTAFTTETKFSRHNMKELKRRSAYWSLRAESQLRKGQTELAVQDFERSLKIEPSNVSAVAGLLWLYIGDGDQVRLEPMLAQYIDTASASADLWAPYAIGYLQVGQAATSVQWFERMSSRLDSDYSLLLTYADALEMAGRAADANKIRVWAVKRLRPLLTEGSREDHELLLQQYTRVASMYSPTDKKVVWADALLRSNQTVKPDSITAQPFWREDMAITWLMASQRQEHARLIMSRLHDQRIAQPAWQSLALAMRDDDVDTLVSLLQEGRGLSAGDQILALRRVGRDQEAYRLASTTLRNPTSKSDSSIADVQYGQLRNLWPSYTSGGLISKSIGHLGIRETGVSLRQSLHDRNLGVGVNVKQRAFDSQRFGLGSTDDESDVALTLFYGDSSSGGDVTVGYLSTEETDRSYADAQYYLRNQRRTRELSANLAYNESVNGSPELRLGAKQHRATFGFESLLGSREFFRVQANATEINTRVQENRVARGLEGRAELGIRGAFGSHLWTTSLQAVSTSYDRADELPAELRYTNEVTMDSILADESSSLSLAFSFSRGGIDNDYPETSSPRYYLNASVGQNWPANSFGMQLNAGVGVRVLGGDELGFSFSHDTQEPTKSSTDNEATSLGVNYRYHF